MADLTNLSNVEQEILKFWEEEGIFAAVKKQAEGKPPFVFYDGPPFTSGLPHYGHIAQMAVKDAVLRYKTMQGFNVPRKIGWDTHGLPVEYELEKELGLPNKKAILDYGIEKFVAAARKIVLRYVGEWKGTMRRMGRWVDVDEPYTTMDNGYIESVWWAFSELYKEGLVYRDYRVGPYCPRCGTTLSNFELNQGYKDNVSDPGVTVAFPLIGDDESELKQAKLVIWTTTPWTLPSNAGIAVNPKLTYTAVRNRQTDETYIVASDRFDVVFSVDEYEVVAEFAGEKLVGKRYQPPYEATTADDAYTVIDGGDEVSVEEGTGLLHVAPAYGEADFELGKKNHLPLLQSVHLDGTIAVGTIKGLPDEVDGLFVKAADKRIIADLSARGLLIKSETITHTYPFCWRCDSPLLYLPTESWYIKVTALKDRLVAENNEIHWQPEHLRQGRFGKWLEGARDWAVSRERFWGAPIPIWECRECHELKVVPSREDLNLDPKFDLHRPYIDDVTMPCPKCKQAMRRVTSVFDCWFESGSMPFAQHHYPKHGRDLFDPSAHIGYPADFIVEALDQTRGWFYTLHVLGVALFNQKAFKNVDVSGLILDAQGKKLSKRLRNYPDPSELFESQGVDALRLFLFTATRLGEEFRFNEAMVADVKRRWLIPLLNTLNFYQLYQDQATDNQPNESEMALDRYIHARVQQAEAEIVRAMDRPNGDRSGYDVVTAARTFGPLIEDLSAWYVRLSRRRTDRAFFETLRATLIAIAELMAPFTPFVAEHLYRSVRSDSMPVSVHLVTDRFVDQPVVDDSIVDEMAFVRDVVAAGREARAKAGMPIKQPLRKMCVKTSSASLPGAGNIWDTVLEVFQSELQVKEVCLNYIPEDLSASWVTIERPNFSVALDTTITDDLKYEQMANVLRRTIQDMRKELMLSPMDRATVYVSELPEAVRDYLMRQLSETTELIDVRPSTSRAARELELDGEVISVVITG